MPILDRRARLSRLSPLALTLLVACGGPDGAPTPPPATPVAPPAATPPPATAPSTAARGVDTSALDTSVRPASDFYEYANGAWLKRTEIPADKTSVGPFSTMADQSELRTRAILEELAASTTATGDAKKAGDFYASFMDEAAIEKLGARPIAADLARIAKIADKRALAKALGASIRADVDIMNHTSLSTPHFLGLWAEQDLNDPSRVVPYLVQGGLGMPDRSYFIDDSPRMADLRTKYQAHVAKMLTLAGVSNAEARAARVFALEKKMAAVHASRADSGEVTKGNNPWAQGDFAKRAPGLDWSAFFGAAGLDKQPTFIAWQPGAITGLAALVAGEPLASWKDWMTAHAIEEAAPYLSKAFVDERFAFYGTTLSGAPQQRDRWKRGVECTGGTNAHGELDDAVGREYAARHFPAERKRAILTMVDGIKAAFARRIDALSWMSPETKTKAKAKLATLIVGIGYPDTFIDYTGLEIVRGDALGNAERGEKWRYLRSLSHLGKPQDRAEWVLSPQTVNAVNLPFRNALNFPAAILEPPFYVAEATAAVNYAAIGAVIGHEISHSFDSEGALVDATGKFVRWWTPDDFAHFEASGAALAAQYDAYHPFPDVAVNGKQTLGENIADLAGLAASYDAWTASLGGAPAPVVDGLTGDQQFFVGYEQTWQNKTREAAMRKRLAADGHSPPVYRAATVRNLDAWYAAFDVKPTDPLYLAPSARVRVW